jgi:hypothetical protein
VVQIDYDGDGDVVAARFGTNHALPRHITTTTSGHPKLCVLRGSDGDAVVLCDHRLDRRRGRHAALLHLPWYVHVSIPSSLCRSTGKAAVRTMKAKRTPARAPVHHCAHLHTLYRCVCVCACGASFCCRWSWVLVVWRGGGDHACARYPGHHHAAKKRQRHRRKARGRERGLLAS